MVAFHAWVHAHSRHDRRTLRRASGPEPDLPDHGSGTSPPGAPDESCPVDTPGADQLAGQLPAPQAASPATKPRFAAPPHAAEAGNSTAHNARKAKPSSRHPRKDEAMPPSALAKRFTSKVLRTAAGGLAAAALLLGTSSAIMPAQASAAPAVDKRIDGWINHALLVMKGKGIPGSYDGIYRNLMRESSGDVFAINLWDSNAKAGIPSKGLMQVIDPTFRAYHVAGTSWDIYDPIANITAACNYAAHRYGSIDNVNGPY
ncbi:transglycosylase SLT domain-containing protein [Streptomyces sp. NPDC054904]